MYHDVELMLKVLRRVEEGLSYRRVAKELGVSRSKVSRVMKWFKTGRAVAVHDEKGYPIRVVQGVEGSLPPGHGEGVPGEGVPGEVGLMLRVAEAQGGFKQKHCGDFGEDGWCRLEYGEPIEGAPVEWIEKEGRHRLKPSRLWCALCPYFRQR